MFLLRALLPLQGGWYRWCKRFLFLAWQGGVTTNSAMLVWLSSVNCELSLAFPCQGKNENRLLGKKREIRGIARLRQIFLSLAI